MRDTVERTATNVLITTLHDMAYGIWDSQGRAIAIPEGFPCRLISSSFPIRAVIKQFSGNIYPGDVYYHNCPATGGSHKSDCCAYRPVFWENELVFWAVDNAHLSDTGGGVPGGYNPLAEDIYAEGFRISPIKIYERGKPRRDIIDMLVGSVRTSRHTRGDIRAQPRWDDESVAVADKPEHYRPVGPGAKPNTSGCVCSLCSPLGIHRCSAHRSP
jgi:N-methylhydantoinase B